MLDKLPLGAPIELHGTIFRELYRGDDFAVVVVDCKDEPVTIVGDLPQLRENEEITVVGKVVNSPKFGKQVRVERLVYNLPTSKDAVERFLASGLIKGIGPFTAAAVVRMFGETALDVLDQDPSQYLRIAGIGKSKLKDIVDSWQEHRASRALITLLSQHDISVNQAAKICKEYGADAEKIIHANPYQVAYDISGIGFKRADSLARSFGFNLTDPRRIQAGLYFALYEGLSDGHVCLPLETLTANTAKMLDLNPSVVDWSMHILATDISQNIFLDTIDGLRVAYIKPYYHAECGVASGIHKLITADRSRLKNLKVDELTLDERLSDEQAQAVRSALSIPVSLITGGPGCGKSFLVKALVDILHEFKYKFALAAPTGRAAKRLNEATGQEAFTIHRLLGLNKDDSEVVVDLEVDMVIIDEVSMVDVILMHKLLKAIRPDTHLVLVGDADQLPSVGAGNVLHDLIGSGIIPVTRLTRIFRQAEGSAIITNAHLVNSGQIPSLDIVGPDFFFFGLPKERISAEIMDLVSNRIPARLGFTPDQVQVLTPMQKGENGVRELNKALQNQLNPLRLGEKPAHGIYRVGDRVMQTRNNYDKGVFNGDMGIINSIDPEVKEEQVAVSFEGIGLVPYELDELTDQLVLSYAITIHKSQGGEYPCALIVLSSEHRVMLQRNLLYTAITRAKRCCIIIGSRQAVALAVQNNQVKKRHSGLVYRLLHQAGDEDGEK